MRRSQLRRGTKPLRRKTRLRARSKKNSYRRRPRDFKYMSKVRRLSCAVRKWMWTFRSEGDPPYAFDNCNGRVTVDHAGSHGLGQKCPDDETIPLCVHHHGCKTDLTGVFDGWTAGQIREWLDYAIRKTREEIYEMDAYANTRFR